MAPLILFTSGYYHQTLLQTRFRDAGLTPNVLFSSNQLLTIKSFVRQNLAGAFLLPQVIEPGENIIALPVDPPLPLNIAVGMVVCCTMYAFYTLFRKGDM